MQEEVVGCCADELLCDCRGKVSRSVKYSIRVMGEYLRMRTDVDLRRKGRGWLLLL